MLREISTAVGAGAVCAVSDASKQPAQKPLVGTAAGKSFLGTED